MRPHGSVIVYGTGRPVAELPMFFCLSNAIAVRFIFHILSDADRRVAEEDITTLLEADRLRNNIAATFNLSDSVAAHEATAQGPAPRTIAGAPSSVGRPRTNDWSSETGRL